MCLWNGRWRIRTVPLTFVVYDEVTATHISAVLNLAKRVAGGADGPTLTDDRAI
jgi:hypothetical protein